MAALSSLAIGLSAAAGVGQAVTAAKSAKEQRARIRRQEEAAKAAAALRETREDTGAEIELGSENIEEEGRRKRRAARRNAAGGPLGNVGGLGASGAVGLR